MKIEQNWNFTNLELHLLKDYITPLSGIYILASLNGDALEFEKGGFMGKRLNEVYYTLDPSAFPSYNCPELTKEQELSERIAIRKMYADFDMLYELWASSKRDNPYETPSFMIDWALSKKYKPEWLDWAIKKQLYIPKQAVFPAGADIKMPTARETYAVICRQYGQEFIDAQDEMPKMSTIALHVHLRLKDEKRFAPRGDYWTTETIIREALGGITGRKANGKK